MATLTTNISNVSLTVSGNTTQTATISWTCPTIPAGSTITSCTLTGRATASMNKGNATIKVNGTTVSSGSNFTINLGTGNTTSSVSATAVGGNKNASGTVTLSNLVYTVNYTEPVVTYTVTFKDWDGSVLKAQNVESGSAATAPSNPSRDGYEFTGWDKSFSNITSDLTVTAQYSIKTYTVRFYNDSTILKTETVEHGKSATAPTSPVKEGHTFTGWDKDFTNITSDLNIYAQYKIIKYTVTFVDWDGAVLKTEEVEYGGSATAPDVSREGYEFTGWSVDFSNVIRDIITVAQFEAINGDTLHIKENGNWINIDKVYKRVLGHWVEQKNVELDNLFNSNVRYNIGVSSPIAIYYSDGTLAFQDSDILDTSHGSVIKTYTDYNYSTASTPPWFDNRANINNIVINTIASPISTRYWFHSCAKVISLDLSNFDTSNVTNMSYMFYNCKALTSLDLSNFDMTNVTSTSNMFQDCTNLRTIYVKDEAAKTKIESSTNFPTTATVVIGSPN